jgi:Lrp/AsnC family transcriptional regulator, regulator for asnA, asnC and gidA
MLDEVDKRLLQILQVNGRKKNVEIAEVLGIAESTVRNRIRKLINDGVASIVAMPRISKLGIGCISIVGLQIRLPDVKQVSERLAQNQNVYFVATITGHFDLIMIVAFHNTQELSNFMSKEVFKIPSVLRSETYVCIEIGKSPWGKVKEESFEDFDLYRASDSMPKNT